MNKLYYVIYLPILLLLQCRYMNNAFATLSSLLKQSPRGRLLSHCLPFLVSATNINNKSENGNDNKTEKNEKSVTNCDLSISTDILNNGNSSNSKNNVKIHFLSAEQKQRRMSAIDAISDLFLAENEILTVDNDGKIKIIGGSKNEDTSTSHDSSAHAHVHTSSCTHDHDEHVQERWDLLLYHLQFSSVLFCVIRCISHVLCYFILSHLNSSSLLLFLIELNEILFILFYIILI